MKNSAMNFSVGMCAAVPVGKIHYVDAVQNVDSSKCECTINIGIFFDGTGNNYENDRPKLAHTNICRLFDAYRENPNGGYFPLYVPGVGTPFPEIREEGESSLGGGFGIGCESRVLYALCFVLNSLHRAAFNQLLLNQDQVRVLSCSQDVNSSFMSRDDVDVLVKMGLMSGLRMPDTVGEGNRDTILRKFASHLEAKLEKSRSKVKECFVDVFGFSRGAAQARVFCSWLDRLLVDGTFAGVRLHFRFLGIMDTVASAGFWSSMAGGLTGADSGHSGWADAEYLLIPKSIRNCVHMVAMHELRRNFPLDTVTVDGVLPPNCLEYAYPGVHSDIGGGYAPGELGVTVGGNERISDALKLSQITLIHMLMCGTAAGTPFKIELAEKDGYNPFTVHPRVSEAFAAFLNYHGAAARPLNKWLQMYLNWRWQIRQNFASQAHAKRATGSDRQLLLDYNQRLTRDATLIGYFSRAGWLRRRVDPTIKAVGRIVSRLDDEAAEVLHLAKSAEAVGEATHSMFVEFVHDSMAGFNRAEVEWTGYWRYRKGFLGNRRALIASTMPADGETEVA